MESFRGLGESSDEPVDLGCERRSHHAEERCKELSCAFRGHVRGCVAAGVSVPAGAACAAGSDSAGGEGAGWGARFGLACSSGRLAITDGASQRVKTLPIPRVDSSDLPISPRSTPTIFYRDEGTVLLRGFRLGSGVWFGMYFRKPPKTVLRWNGALGSKYTECFCC